MPRHFGLTRPRRETARLRGSAAVAALLGSAGIAGFFAATWAISFARSLF